MFNCMSTDFTAINGKCLSNELYLLCYLLLFLISSCQRSLQSGFSLSGSALIDGCLIRTRTVASFFSPPTGFQTSIFLFFRLQLARCSLHSRDSASLLFACFARVIQLRCYSCFARYSFVSLMLFASRYYRITTE